MTNVKTLSKVIAIALLAAGATQATAKETVNSTATVKVQNAFDLAENTGLDFGTLRVTADTGTAKATAVAATVTVKSDGSGTTAANPSGSVLASAQVIAEGSPATYTVTKVAPFSKMVITFPADDSVILSAASAPNETSKFTLSGFEAYVTSGANANTAYDTGTSNLAADVDGTVTFAVGATLNTDKRGTEGAITQYIDGDYTGKYDIIVAY